MQKELKFDSFGIPCQLKFSRRAKYMRLSVFIDSSVVLTVPQGLNLSLAESFFRAKVDWIRKKIIFSQKFPGRIWLKSGKREYFKLKGQSLALAVRKTRYWNQFYDFSYKKISIKNQKTRWGSSSKKGNLNFNYKIIHLPEPLLDYLVVHELCHLKEFNHSKEFWNLVGRTVPNFTLCRAQLRKIFI